METVGDEFAKMLDELIMAFEVVRLTVASLMVQFIRSNWLLVK